MMLNRLIKFATLMYMYMIFDNYINLYSMHPRLSNYALSAFTSFCAIHYWCLTLDRLSIADLHWGRDGCEYAQRLTTTAQR